MTATLVGLGHDLPGRLFRRMRLHQGRQLAVLQMAGHAVGAEQQVIPCGNLPLKEVDFHRRAGAQGTSDHVPLRVAAGLFAREQAQAHLLFDPGVVLGDLANALLVDKIGPAVAHTGHKDLAAQHHRCDEGGAHARAGLISLGLFVDLPVGSVKGPHQAGTHVGVGVAVVLADGQLDRPLTGHLARLVAAHAIGHSVHDPFARPLLRVGRDVGADVILVVVPCAAHIGQLGRDQVQRWSATFFLGLARARLDRVGRRLWLRSLSTRPLGTGFPRFWPSTAPVFAHARLLCRG